MKTFIETFDNGPGGWIGWNHRGANGPSPIETRNSVAVSRGPWWLDYNHAPPGAGYLHILFGLHTFHGPDFSPAVLKVGGTNPFVEGGYPTDFRNAKITVRIKGDVKLRGAQLVLLVQGNVSRDRGKPNWVNQVLSAQPLRITPDWSEQTIVLVPDQKQWVNLGSRQDRVGYYGKAPIEDLLRDVNGDIIFVLFPLDVIPLEPVNGDPHVLHAGVDYEVDRMRLPEGCIMLDEVRIEFP